MIESMQDGEVANLLVNHMNTTNSFQDIMAEYRDQSSLMKWAIRTYAVDALKDEGSFEIGSSDVNHKIVQLYKQYGSFGNVVITALGGEVENSTWRMTL